MDVSVPTAASSLRVGGSTQIVYELHITNFLQVDVAITRIQVVDGDFPRKPIGDLGGSELSRAIGRPGVPRNRSSPEVVGPGMRAVVYMWMPLPEHARLPRRLTHVVDLEIRKDAGPVLATIEGAPATLARDPVLVLDPPLRGGPWVAIYSPLLMGGHRTAIYAVEGRARIPGRFAIDWVRLPPSGVMERQPGLDATTWNGFGSEVLAVSDGIIAAAADDVADNDVAPDGARPVIPLELASGNYVALDLGGGRFAFYEHLKHGSVTVKRGDRVRRGDVVGRLGYSGSSSIGPHLHFHVADANSPLEAEGLPFHFRQFEAVGAFPSIDALVAGERWMAYPANYRQRRHERPAPNAVVTFSEVR